MKINPRKTKKQREEYAKLTPKERRKQCTARIKERNKNSKK